MESEAGAAAIVPTLVVVVDWVVVVTVTGSVDFVMVVVSCATAVVKANALIAPIANILLNLLSFMFVLCFVKRMLPVVINFDCFWTGLIQPQRRFVDSEVSGRISRRYAPMISFRF